MKRLAIGLGLWILWSAAGEASPRMPQSEPEPGAGGAGIRVTVAQLMALEQNAVPSVRPPRPKRRMASASKKMSGVSTTDPSAASKSGAPVGPLTPQVAGTLFNGDSASALTVTPPDSMGAAGPTQFLVCTNNNIKVFSKELHLLRHQLIIGS